MFYIVLDADGNIHLYKRLAAKDGKTKLRKVAVNIPQKLAEWGSRNGKNDENIQEELMIIRRLKLQ